MDITTAQGTIQIRGRQYSVSKEEREGKEIRYRLTGKRGASFVTMRNVHHPDKMFVVSHSLGNKTLDGVWLSDAGGDLRVAQQ